MVKSKTNSGQSMMWGLFSWRSRKFIRAASYKNVEHISHWPNRRKHNVKIYDTVDNAVMVSSHNPSGGAAVTLKVEIPVIPPNYFLLHVAFLHRPLHSIRPPNREVLELLLLTSQAKCIPLRSGGADEPLIAATAGWQFTPAFCRFRLSLEAYKEGKSELRLGPCPLLLAT